MVDPNNARSASPTALLLAVPRAAAILTVAWFALVLSAPLAPHAHAQDTADPLREVIGALEFREIGPAIMGGRISDVALSPGEPATIYIGYSIGGLWKTTSHGLDWTPIFDEQPNSSIGAVTVAPSNPNVVWVGTGEPQNRQSTPYGNGVYRSLDAGRSWEHMGLRDTRHTGRIVIHPTNPDIVYVAAVGQLSAPNEERGVFRTTDAGETWEKVLYLDEHTGAIDLIMHPSDPHTLFAAMYQRERKPWGFSADGDGSGIYRTLDGGESWEELEEGLPEGYKGRIGLDIYRQDGNLVYAVVESSGDGRGVYRSTDRGESWEKMSDRNPRPMYFSLIRIDPNDPERIYLGGVQLSISEDGGRTWREGDQADGIHVDHHALRIDPDNSNHIVLGHDGGVATSWDRGETWRHHDNMAMGQFYQLGLDNGDPYRICGGLQDNYSWCGASQTRSNHGILNRDWIAINGGDGFWNAPDPSDPNVIYTESQNGNIRRFHYDLGEAASIRPQARPSFDEEERDYRWNWNTPIHVSHHDPSTIYVGANHLMRGLERAQRWEEASPDLTRQVDRDTLAMMGMPTTDETLSRNDGVSHYGTIVEIGESPLDPDVLYVGTDDGVLQRTRDGGETWTDVTETIPGLEHGMVVSGIEASHHEAGRVYMAFDGHWVSDYRPYVYVSEDYGDTWTEITQGLDEDGTVNVIREHPDAAELLFVGTELGLYASFDRGDSFERLHGTNFPPAPVDDMRIHPRENDLVVGTHGRSVWILDDITPLEEIARDGVLDREVHLFPVRRATMWRRKGIFGFWGDGVFRAPNPPEGAVVRYWLAEGVVDTHESEEGDNPEEGADPADTVAVELQILDGGGNVIRSIDDAPAESGFQEVIWDFREDPPYETAQGSGRGRGGVRGPLRMPGDFTARLIVGGDTLVQSFEVRQDPEVTVARGDLVTRREAIDRINVIGEPLYWAGQAVGAIEDRIDAMRELVDQSQGADESVVQALDDLEEQLEKVDDLLDEANSGRQVLNAIEGVSTPPTEDQIWMISRGEAAAPGAVEALNELIAGPLYEVEERIYTPAVRPERIEPVDPGPLARG